MPKLPNIHPELIQQYQEEISKTSSAATAKRKVVSLKRFFDWAHGAGHVPQNPFAQTQVPTDSRTPVAKKKSSLKTVASFGALGVSLIALFFALRFVKLPISFVNLFAQMTPPESKIQTVQNNQNPTNLGASPQPGIPASSAVVSGYNLFTKLQLTDSGGNPQVGSMTLTFKLYKDESDSTPLWTSDPETVTPDTNGSALVSLDGVPTELFFNNNTLYLGIVDGGSEISSRLPVSTASTPANLGGFFPADPETGALGNTVPVIAADGSLLIASEAPAIKATSGNFLIEGQAVTIKTADGGDGNIEINPDGGGITHFLFEGTGKNYLNAQAPNLTSGSLYYGIVANNSTGYDLLRLQSGSSPTTKFSVDARGNTFIDGTLTVDNNINVTGGGGVQIAGVTRLTSLGRLTSITGYYQDSGLFQIDQGAPDYAKITKILSDSTGASTSDVLTLTLDESTVTTDSGSDTLVLNRLGGTIDAFALFVDEGNVRFDGQVQLGRFDTNPTAIGQGSIVYNTGDDNVYYWDGTSWVQIATSASGFSGSFADLTSGTNNIAAMVVGTGASLTYSGSGTINATTLNSIADTSFLRSDTSDNFTSGTLTTDAGTTLDVNGDLVVSDTNIAFDGASTTFTTTGDLTLALGGGDLILNNTQTINIGGNGSDVVYNAIANSVAGASASMDADNDLYIEGDLEVDGTIFGTVVGTVPWSEIDDPTGNLTLTMGDGEITTFDIQSDTETGFAWNTSTLTTGNLLSLASTSTAMTSANLLNIAATGDPAASWTGSLAKIEYATSTDADIDGSALKVGITGAGAGDGTALNVTTAQTGSSAYALRVNDDGTYTDTTAFVVNASGDVGVGTSSPLAKFDVRSPTATITFGSILNTPAADQNFSSDTGNWTGTNWTIGSGVATHTAGANTFTLSTVAATVGTTYEIDYTINTTTPGTIHPTFGGVNGYDIGQSAGSKSVSIYITAISTGGLSFTPDANWAGTLDNVFVYEVIENNPAVVVENTNGTIGLEIRSGGNTSGHANTYIGLGAGEFLGAGNTNNTALGYQALGDAVASTDNTAIGYFTLWRNTTGTTNTALGSVALQNNTEGSDNLALGYNSLLRNTIGNKNTAVGVSALSLNTTGSNNIVMGYQAANALLTGSNNIVIGHDIDLPSTSTSNTLDLGNIIYATGVDGSGTSVSSGNVGIRDSSPDAFFEVLGTTEQLRLTHTDDTTDCRFTVSSTGDMTLDCLGSGSTDQFVLGDTDTINIGTGTASDVAYNVIASGADAADEGAIAADNDLYIGGDLEVDGTIYGNVSGTISGTIPWNEIDPPAADLTLAMSTWNTTFNWDPGPDSAETNFSLTTQGEDTIAGGEVDQVLLALSQTSNGVDVDQAADALLTFTNNDANDPVTNAIRFDAGAAGTDFTYGINFDAASIGTAEILLQNGETIDNTVDGTVLITSPTTQTSGNLTVAGTTGLTFSGVGGQINFTNGETIDNDTDGTIQVTGNLGVSTGTITGANSEQLLIGATNDLVQVVRGGSTYTVCDTGNNCSSSSSVLWNNLNDPTTALDLNMTTYNTNFDWTPVADFALIGFSMSIVGQDAVAGGEVNQVLLALYNISNGADSDQAADALLTFTNNDANDPVVNAIRFDAGGAGTDFTYGINFDAASIGTAELLLQNGETIDNTVDGTVLITSPTTQTSGNLTVAGTTGLTFTGVGGDITFTNGEKIDNDTDGTVLITAPTTQTSGNLTVAGTTGLTFSGVGGQINFTNGETIDNDTDGSINIGATTLELTGVTTIHSDQATVALLNTTTTTLNIGGAATTINLGPTGSGASSIVLSGGSGDTGCTLNGATGALSCNSFVGTVSGTVPWSEIDDPTGDLTLSMAAYNTTFNWDPGPDSAETNFSLTTQGEDDTAVSGDNDQVLLALSQTSNGVDVTQAADALLTFTNNDANDPVVNAIRFDAGTFTNGINFDASTISSAELVLQNAETISNGTNGAIILTGVGQTNNGALTFDLETNTIPTLTSSTDTAIGIDEDLTFIGAQSITTTTGTLTVTPAGAFEVYSTGNIILDSSADIQLDAAGSDILFQDNFNDFATFNGSGLDLWLNIGDGDFNIANGDRIHLGGLTGVGYNSIANSGEAPEEAAISSDNDLYIGGDLEVDGTIYGNVSGTISGTIPWSEIDNPTGDLTLSMATNNTTFSWDPGDNSAETAFSLTFDGQDTAADEDQVLLALSQIDNATDSTEAADALLTFANNDANDPVENAIRFDAGGANAPDFLDGIDFSGADLNREIVLENGEAIIGQTADTITFEDDDGTDYATLTAAALTVTGDLFVTGDNIDSVGAPLVLQATAADEVRIGDAGTPTTATGDGDLYTSGELEVEGQLLLSNGDFAAGKGIIFRNAADDAWDGGIYMTNGNILMIEGGAGTNPISFRNNDGTTSMMMSTTGDLSIGVTASNDDDRLLFDDGTTEYLEWNDAGGEFRLSDDLSPITNDALNLGSDTLRWQDIYTGPGTVHIGTSTTDEGALSYDTTNNIFNLTSTGTITLDSTTYVRVGDSGTPITATDDDDDLYVQGDLETGGDIYLTGQQIFNVVGGTGTAAISFATDPTAVNNYNSLGYGSWLVENSTNNGIAALMVNQTKGGDIFTASTSGVMKFVIQNDGDVGIGVTPTSKLHVLGDAFIQQTAANTDADLTITGTGNIVASYLALGDSDASATWYWENRSAAANSLVLEYNLTQQPFIVEAATPTNTLYLDSIGAVGIGLANPTFKLEVSKDGGGGDSPNIIKFTDSSTANSVGPFSLIIGPDNHFAVSPGMVLNSTSSLSLAVGTGADLSSARKLTVLSSGNVGIGDTSPDYSLEIFATGVAPKLSLGEDGVASGLSGFETDTFFQVKEYTADGGGAQIAGIADADGSIALSFVGRMENDPINSAAAFHFQAVSDNGAGGSEDLDNAETVFQIGNNDNAAGFTIMGNDFVGIGDITPDFKLDVEDSQASTYVAEVYNTNTTNTADGLLVRIDVATTATGMYFVGFSHNGTIGGKIQGSATDDQVSYTSSGTDYAEYFPVANQSDRPDYGDVVSITDNVSGAVVKSQESDHLLGVITDTPGFIGNGSICPEDDAESCDANHEQINTLVGLTGQIRTKASTINGVINQGDPLMASSIPGVAVKADKAGYIIGHALESYSSSDISRIRVMVYPSWYDPEVFLTDTGDLNVTLNQGNSYQVTNSANNNSIIDKVGAFANLVTANIKAGFIETSDFVAQNVQAGSISAQSLTTDSFSSFQGTIDNLLVSSGLVAANIQTSLISPLPDSTDVTVRIGSESNESGKFAIQDSQGNEVASIDNLGNANFAGDVRSQNIDQIEALLNQVALDQSILLSATSSGSFDATSSANLAQLITNDLYVTGHAAVNTLLVNEDLTVANINSLSGPLRLQSLAAAPIELMAGLVTIDTQGNVNIAGNLNVAGKIRAKDYEIAGVNEVGDPLASINASGSATFNALTTGGLVIAGADATESGTLINGVISTNSTIGKAIVPEGTSEITIQNPKITDNSLIYVTPTSSTQNYVLYVKEKGDGYFKVGFSNPLDIDTNFNWWIVDTQ